VRRSRNFIPAEQKTPARPLARHRGPSRGHQDPASRRARGQKALQQCALFSSRGAFGKWPAFQQQPPPREAKARHRADRSASRCWPGRTGAPAASSARNKQHRGKGARHQAGAPFHHWPLQARRPLAGRGAGMASSSGQQAFVPTPTQGACLLTVAPEGAVSLLRILAVVARSSPEPIAASPPSKGIGGCAARCRAARASAARLQNSKQRHRVQAARVLLYPLC